MMTDFCADRFATIKKLSDEGKLGNIQTVSITVNGKPKRAKSDIAELLLFVNSKPTDLRYVVFDKPYSHGALTITFENAVLARYVITSAPSAERSDWHVYSDKTELYSSADERHVKIIPADIFPKTEIVEFVRGGKVPQLKLPAEALEFCGMLCGQ